MMSAVSEKIEARPSLRGPVFALVLGWLALSIVAAAYARSRGVPSALAIPITLAFLTEYSFYLLLGFPRLLGYVHTRFTRSEIATFIALSALLPFLVYAGLTGTFTPMGTVAWIAVAALTGLWYAFSVRSALVGAVRDFAFLGFLATIILSGVLRWIFPAAVPRLPMEVLGHITLVRSAILAVLLLRGTADTGIGFVPRWRDLAVGFLWFALAALVAVPLGLRLGQLHLSAHTPALWPSLGLLLGVFWVLAFSEEFFFRGLLQQWVSNWTGNRAAGLVLASVLFAACHLGFRGAFPNWRVATLSLVLGLCCGAAFLQARSIRASMVTHALAVSAWRLFLN